MYPHERSLVQDFAGKPFALIGVNSDSSLESIREIVIEEKLTWRSFWNGPQGTDGPISTAWNVSGWPTIYLIDAKGVTRFKDPHGDALDKAILQLIEEAGGE